MTGFLEQADFEESLTKTNLQNHQIQSKTLVNPQIALSKSPFLTPCRHQERRRKSLLIVLAHPDDEIFHGGVRAHLRTDQRIVNSLSTSAEQRYQEVVRTYPSFALRVPQWMLASYLRVSPETLSRVRKSLSRK